MKRKVCAIFFGILFFTQSSVFAKNVRVANISITNTYNGIELVYLNIKGAFNEEMGKAILSGVPITFSFFIVLNKVRTIWLSKEIKEIRITHTVKYSSLKKEFIIKRSWENDRSLVVKSFNEAKKLMTEIEHLKIFFSPPLEKGEKYRISAKAELSKITLPYYLHYVLFFVSLWNFETDWYSIDFVY